MWWYKSVPLLDAQNNFFNNGIGHFNQVIIGFVIAQALGVTFGVINAFDSQNSVLILRDNLACATIAIIVKVTGKGFAGECIGQIFHKRNLDINRILRNVAAGVFAKDNSLS